MHKELFSDVFHFLNEGYNVPDRRLPPPTKESSITQNAITKKKRCKIKKWQFVDKRVWSVFGKWNFPMTTPVRLLVGWSVG